MKKSAALARMSLHDVFVVNTFWTRNCVRLRSQFSFEWNVPIHARVIINSASRFYFCNPCVYKNFACMVSEERYCCSHEQEVKCKPKGLERDDCTFYPPFLHQSGLCCRHRHEPSGGQECGDGKKDSFFQILCISLHYISSVSFHRSQVSTPSSTHSWDYYHCHHKNTIGLVAKIRSARLAY